MTRSFIEITDLEHTYLLEGSRRIVALEGVDLTIERGDYVAVIGPNGSGKSTLALHFNALLLPTQGQVRVDGLLTSDPDNQWAVRERVGMVFQNPDNQLVASTVEEEVAFGPENWALPSEEIRRRVDETLEIVELTDYRKHPPHMLSGGQKQLLVIAGVLATRPACIVFDEPTSMLDPPGRRRVMETIRQLNDEEGITVILITQTMEEAALAKRVLVLNGGRIVMDGPPGQILAQGEQLQKLGLDAPLAARVAHLLRQQGMELRTDLLTVQELAAALGASSPRRRVQC
ncbi:MAG: energy-coupling factor transporter ATPase [Anaerolineae bacterium]|jgi:energy-coupling factor transport system ATP-binding protein